MKDFRSKLQEPKSETQPKRVLVGQHAFCPEAVAQRAVVLEVEDQMLTLQSPTSASLGDSASIPAVTVDALFLLWLFYGSCMHCNQYQLSNATLTTMLFSLNRFGVAFMHLAIFELSGYGI